MNARIRGAKPPARLSGAVARVTQGLLLLAGLAAPVLGWLFTTAAVTVATWDGPRSSRPGRPAGGVFR